jgi:hypothetical protein
MYMPTNILLLQTTSGIESNSLLPQYPQDMEMENVELFTAIPTKKARQAYAERSNGSPV